MLHCVLLFCGYSHLVLQLLIWLIGKTDGMDNSHRVERY